MMPPAPTRAELDAVFRAAGGTDWDYLDVHYARMAATQARFAANHADAPGRLVDIGAHWLHQTLIWRLAGWRASAVDIRATFDDPAVVALARANGIELVVNDSLECPDALDRIGDDSVDVVLFTEIIEHIAFNPLALWRQIHRVLRKGGSVVLTTPNYYALRGRAWSPLRFLAGGGGGIEVAAIVGARTHAHHWKEYSRRELVDYFARVSPDFRIARFAYTTEPRVERFRSPVRRAVLAIERLVPVLRPGLYVEIELASKQAGVRADPGW